MPTTASELEKQLRAATRTGKYIVGRKEVLGSLKGSKLLVWSASANLPPEILNQCQSLEIPALRFDGNPIELGRACGIPYKVSVIAVRSAGDADLSNFSGSRDYSPARPGILAQTRTLAPAAEEAEPVVEEEEEIVEEEVVLAEEPKKAGEKKKTPKVATKKKAAATTPKKKSAQQAKNPRQQKRK